MLATPVTKMEKLSRAEASFHHCCGIFISLLCEIVLKLTKKCLFHLIDSIFPKFQKLMLGLGWCSVSNTLTAQTWMPRVQIPSTHMESRGNASTSNPAGIVEVGVGGPLDHPGSKPALTVELQNQLETLSQNKKGRKHLRKNTQCQPLATAHMHMCTLMCTCTHTIKTVWNSLVSFSSPTCFPISSPQEPLWLTAYITSQWSF